MRNENTTPPDATAVGLAFDRVQLVPPFEAYTSRCAQEQPIRGAIRSAGTFLEGQAVEMVSQPGMPIGWT